MINVDKAGWHIWQSANGAIVANGPDEWNRHLQWPSVRMAIDYLAAWNRAAAFAVYQQAAAELEREAAAASVALQAFPKTGPMGLTGDATRALPEWQAAQGAYQWAADELRRLNGANVKRFARELAAERKARRAAKIATLSEESERHPIRCT